ncbi:DUF2865 domain-containing protein [Bradyrhizobium canariense]|uniref:DUF2865 domain-containing protein n=1 Tax=Bradyrhizobium canariense TaxID=255045 RepID=A0A1H1S6M2_9BRAD|nr:DUF2865 domain-containing protein [Bradyrhizobium canariense]SDS43624.1 Protein of unknown function [Bradyrhizobium canariense]
MPETLITRFPKSILACVALLGVLAPGVEALAQMDPNAPPPSQGAPANPMCPRLEGQLAAIDRGGSTGDPAKDDQIRRYQDAANKQQGELDRVTSQAKRMGCDSSGFFSLFSGQSAQCGPVNNQIQQMRANLDQITSSLERLRGGGFGSDRDNQRRSVLTALAQNNCGPQYAAALNNGPGNFLNNLFGGNNNNPNPGAPGADTGPQSGTYRTVCARSCDGFYFPISFATVPGRFPDDEKTCKALCPAADATLFTYRNPGEDMSSAVSINGQPYSSSPNAFRYRQEFNPSCSCKAPGQTWSDALKNIDDKAAAAQQGDIIVTEESAKKMSQAPSKPVPTSAKKGNAPAGAAPVADDPAGAGTTAAAPSGNATDNKSVRTVGPTFIPAR